MKEVQKAHAESSFMSMSFLHYFHAAISNQLSEMPKNMSYFIWSLNTGLTVYLVLRTFRHVAVFTHITND